MANLEQRIINEYRNLYERKYSIKVPDDWLSQCVQFHLEEFPNKSVQEYRELVHKQLLDFDLSEIHTSSLPAELYRNHSGFLSGTYLLQINLCFDSNQSFYSQIQALKGDINENAFVDADIVPTATQFEKKDVKKNRLMTLKLTDGENNIKAFEFNHIPFLHENILPGTKVELSGRISYRNQVLFIGPENIRLLPGTVSDIGTKEHLIFLMEKELYEKMSNENQTTADRERVAKFENSTIRRTNDSKNNYQVKKEVLVSQTNIYNNTNHYESQTAFKSNNYNKQQQYQKPNSMYQSRPVMSNDDDDDDLLLANLDKIETKPPSFSTNIKTEQFSMKRPPSSEIVSKLNAPNDRKPSYQAANTSSTRNFPTKPETGYVKKIKVESNSDEELLLENINDDYFKPRTNYVQQEAKPLNKVNNLMIKTEKTTLETNFITKIENENYAVECNLSDLLEVSFLNSCCKLNRPDSIEPNQCFTNLSTCSHVFRGSFRTLTAPLKQMKSKWYQECIVTDGIARLPVYIHNDPLCDLLELTCKEAKDLYKKSLERNGSNNYQQIFERKRNNCQIKLEKMSSNMMLKYDFDKESFCVYRLDNVILK